MCVSTAHIRAAKLYRAAVPQSFFPGRNKMPRVVPDQKTKFETDEIFKKLSQDVDVSCLL